MVTASQALEIMAKRNDHDNEIDELLVNLTVIRLEAKGVILAQTPEDRLFVLMTDEAMLSDSVARN